jgi:mono/diheme cytochrome c family protein
MYKKLFLWGNIALFVLLILAIAKDLFRPWMPYQRKYREMQVAAEPAPEAKEMIASRPVEIKQMILTDLSQVDRCVTCHQGMDPIATPTLTNDFKENPYKSHPGDFLKNHPPDKFGCVICHGGQGLSTDFIGAAHTPRDEAQRDAWRKNYNWTPAEHWERPMLASPYIQASCVKCHGNFESLPGEEVVAKGKKLLETHGCLGCHQWHGEGGPISVDLAEETANKPLTRIDFSHSGLDAEDRTLLNWIRLHFLMDPKKLTPGDPEAHFNAEPIAPSGMQDFTLPSAAFPNDGPELKPDDATALTTYILSQQSLAAGPTPPTIPHAYYVEKTAKDQTFDDVRSAHGKIAAGKWVYDKYGCAACHGLNAKGGRFNFNYQGGGWEPVLVKTVPNYTRDELRKKIQQGVAVVSKDNPSGPTPPLYMPAWKDKIKGEELETLMDYLFSIGEKQEEF